MADQRHRGGKQIHPSPICATSMPFEICVHETVVRKLRPGPLRQACNLLTVRKIGPAAGLAVALIAAWRFLWKTNSRRAGATTKGERIEAESGSVVDKRKSSHTHELQKKSISANRISFIGDQSERQAQGHNGMREDQESEGRDGQMSAEIESAVVSSFISTGPARAIEAIGATRDGAKQLEKLGDMRHALTVDLEQSAAESRAAAEGLRQGYSHLYIEAGSSPGSSVASPKDLALSPTSEESSVAALLAKAKATSEKVDRIHERLRRLSKGDGPK
jgi:hypothetical protein